jgi:hypothetical protein
LTANVFTTRKLSAQSSKTLTRCCAASRSGTGLGNHRQCPANEFRRNDGSSTL